MRDLRQAFDRFVDRLKSSRLPAGRLRRRPGGLGSRGGHTTAISRLKVLEALETRVLLATTIGSSSTTPGVPYVVTDPDEIVVAANVVIDTSSLTGAAGKISLSAPKITFQAGARLLATSAGGMPDGSIELTANASLKLPVSGPVLQIEDLLGNQSQIQSSITFQAGGSGEIQTPTIQGGDVTIQATGSNDPQGIVFPDVIDSLGPYLMNATGKPDAFSLPLAFQSWIPKAQIALAGVTVSSSGTVTVTSSAVGTALGRAAYDRLITTDSATGGGILGMAAGWFETDATATIDLTDGTQFDATGDVTLQTEVENTIELSVRSIKNNGITTTNPRAVTIGAAYTDLKSTSIVTLDATSSINAGGQVSIQAEATNSNTGEVFADAFRDGTLGATFTGLETRSTIQTIIAGTISAGQTPPTGALDSIEFNPALTVDFANSTLVFPTPVGFTLGQPLVFTTDTLGTIPQLRPGSTYYAMPVTGNPQGLQLAATQSDAQNGLFLEFGTPFPTLTSGALTVPVTMVDPSDTATLLFGYATVNGAPVFTTGDVVTYAPVTGRFLGYNDAVGHLVGALPAGVYSVEVVESSSPELFPLAIQLRTTAGNPLGGYSTGEIIDLHAGAVLTTAGGTLLPVYGFDLDSSQLNLNAPGTGAATAPGVATSPLQNADAVVFHGGLYNPTLHLLEGTTYFALVDPEEPGLIRLAESAAQAVAQNPAVLEQVPSLITISNQSFLSSSATSFSGGGSLTQTQAANGSYELWTNASGGTFTLTVQTPRGAGTTSAIAYDAPAETVAAALNALPGLVVTVTGAGTRQNPWTLAGQYELPIGNFESSSAIVFDFDPGFAPGTPVRYSGVTQKPVAGLTEGSTYYAFPAVNPFFNPNLPQYLLTLSEDPNSSSPTVEIDLSQSLSDAQSQVYTILGVLPEQNLLRVALPGNALVTAAGSAELSGGSVETGVVAAGAVQLASQATSGTFVLEVTIGDTLVKTPDLAWNATAAEVQSALNALAGVAVTVTGAGTFASPWTIVGLAYASLAADSSNLRFGSVATTLMQRELVNAVSQVTVTATGGTFTLTLTAGGQSQTTPPIAWDASADQLATTINTNLTGILAVVSGTGAVDDPWLIMAGFQSITTGMPLVFRDSWNLQGLGITEGQTCYAVVTQDQMFPYEMTIGLAASLADAQQSSPVLINQQPWFAFGKSTSGILTGSTAMLASESPPNASISISAVLHTSDSGSAEAKLGGVPEIEYLAHPQQFWAGRHPISGNNALMEKIKAKIPPGLNLPNEWELAACVVVMNVRNLVQSLVLGTAVLEAQGDITITGDLTEITHSKATASIVKPTSTRDDKAVAIAVDVVQIDNTAQAVIAPGASVSATGDLSVTATVVYPLWFSISGLPDWGNVVAFFADELWAVNHVAGSRVKQRVNDLDPAKSAELIQWTISFSAASVDVTNNTLAQIADGAQINQLAGFASGGDQAVLVKAKTEVIQNVTANPLQFVYGLILDSASQNSVGGTLILSSLENTTQALVGGDCLAQPPSGFDFSLPASNPNPVATSLAFGNGGLTVSALNLVGMGLLAESAASSTGFGFEGTFVLLDMGATPNTGNPDPSRRTQLTHAQLLTTNRPLNLQSQPATSGDVCISASDQSDLFVVSGSVANGGPSGIGLSGSVLQLARDVGAGVGTANLIDQATSTSQFDFGGDLSITATATGDIAPISLVGRYAGRLNEQPINDKVPAISHDSLGEGAANSASDSRAHWGLTISGDFAGAYVTDTADAWLVDLGTVQSAGGQVNVSSDNTTQVRSVSGSATIDRAQNSEDFAAGASGSVSVITHDSSVEARIASVTLGQVGLGISATNAKLSGSFSGGMQVTDVTGASLDLAGSVAVNTITNVTSAVVDSVVAEDLTGLSVAAIASDEVWAAAGLVSITLDRRDLTQDPEKSQPKTLIGVGASGAINELVNTTTAQVVDSQVTFASGAATIEAADYTRSLVLSAGVDVAVAAGTEVNVGGMFATTNFRPNTQALITGSTLSSPVGNDPQNLEVTALLIPDLVATAGYVAVSWGKEFNTKETQVGVGVGAGVVVTNFRPDGTDEVQTVAQVTNSNLNWNAGDVGVEAYSGQMTAAYATSQTSTKAGNDSLYLLAVAGDAQGEGTNSTSVGVAIVGGVVVTNLALETSATLDSASSVTTAGALDVQATEAFTIKSDAGGSDLTVQLPSGTAVGVAVGGGYNEWNASNQIEATVGDTTVTATALQVDALLATSQTQIAFGVAVDVSAGIELGVSVSLSGAFAYHTLDNTVAATVAGGALALSDSLQVTAADQTGLTIKGGAGAAALGTDAAVAPSSVVGSVTVTNTVQAVVGLTPAGVSDPTTITVGGPVNITATDSADITSTLTAVAVSASAGVALSGSGASASISTANVLTAELGGGSLSAAAASTPSVAIEANQNSTLSTSVGAGALSVAAYGGSLGISLAEITTADTVTALIHDTAVATSGGAVSVLAETTRQSHALSVPTSASISFGAAGAGGNANLTDTSTYQAGITGGSSINTIGTGQPAGDLTVHTLGNQSLTAEIDGGAGGLGAIGVFLSTVERSGSLSSTLETVSGLNVGNLAVTAVASHTVSSTGTSVTIGGLAGSGETHTAEYTEAVSVTLESGPTGGGQVGGSATALAQATTTLHAESTGADAGLMGVGAYTAVATYTPTITTTVDQFGLTAGGAVSISAVVDSSNTGQAIAGSGGLFSAEASVATLTTSPTTTTSITGSALEGASLSLQTLNDLDYNAYADSVNASAVGMSGAVVTNSADPSASLQINTGTTLQATSGQLALEVANTLVNLGGQPSMVAAGDNTESAMVRLGAGGGLVAYAGGLFSTYTPIAGLTVADDVTVSGVQGILATVSQGLETDELAILQTGGVIDVSVTIASLFATLDTTLTVGSNTRWQSTQGGIQLGTGVDLSATNIGVAKTWGLAGGASGNAISDIAVTQGVSLGAGSTLISLDDISIVAGQNPAGSGVTEIDVLTLGLAHFDGAAGDSSASASLGMDSHSTLTLSPGAVITSGGDVTVGATPGVNSTTQSFIHGYDHNFSKSGASSGTVSESALATIDANIEAGAYADLNVAFDTAGTQLTVNGVTTSLNTGTADANGVITQTIAPPNTPGADLFVPFQASYVPQYTPSLAGFDQATAALLETSVSSSPVVAVQLSGLTAQGGQVVVVADQLAGSGNLSANTPRIQITNPSADYLLLNGVAIPGGQTAGQVTLKGATGAAPANPGLTLQPTAGESAIVVSQTYPAAVGSGTSSGPAIYITSYLNNPSGEVSLSNSQGAVIELAPINAASVSIETPNSAFILSTPQAPFGIGGNITDAWGATRVGLNPQSGAGIPTPTGAFLPGQTLTGWDANLAATTVVDYLLNSTSSNLANGARTLANASLSPSDFAEYHLYNDSDVKDSNAPNQDPNGLSQIFFGNSIPFYNTGWSNGNSDGSTSDTSGDAGQASWLGSGSGFLANNADYQFAYNGVGADAGRLPLVLPNLPLSVTQPESVVQKQLSSGLTAAQVSITAALIDINAPLNVGVSRNLNVVLSAALGATLSAYQAAWRAGTQSNPTYTIPETELGDGIEGVTATYNAQTNEITLGSIATSSATVSALLTGGIVSSVSTGKINMIGGPGLTSITNATGVPLVLSGIDSGATQVTGLVEIHDTIQGVSTKYVYTPGEGVDVYTAALFQPYAATPNSAGESALQTYQPLAGLQINQQQNVELVRELNFSIPGGTNNNGSTNITTGLTNIRPAPVGFWNFDNTYVKQSGFGQFHNAGGATITDSELTLTDGATNTAAAAWLTSSLNTTVGFQVKFTYQAAGAKAADGIALVFQNAGFSAIGGTGGSLGYVGITGPTAAYQMNIFDGHNIGTAFVTTNTSGAYNPTGSVNIASGHPIEVVLVYDPFSRTLTETLTDTTTLATYTTTHAGVNLAPVLGESCLIGFTGGDGSATSIQTVSDFTLTTDQTTPWSPPSTTLTLNGVGNYAPVGSPTITSSTNSIELTNGSQNVATAAWNKSLLDLTRAFVIGFVYQTGGTRAGDGMAVVFQNEGLQALGTTEGGLGYVGIAGRTAAYQLSIDSAYGVGSNFVTTNTAGTYISTLPVQLASGSVHVNLVYNPQQQVLVETLTDLYLGGVYTRTYSNIDLVDVLGANQCYVGFTGGSGSNTAVQVVSNPILAFSVGQSAPVNRLLALATQQVNLPDETALAQYVTVGGTQTGLYVTNNFGNNGQGPPWGVGNNHHWNYYYPTEYTLYQSSAVKADNPFSISFAAMQSGVLSVNSNANLVLDGLIRLAGDVTLNSSGSISQTARGFIASQDLVLTANLAPVLEGFTETTAVNTTPSSSSVTLTNGAEYSSSAVWFNKSLDLTSGFTVQFTYQAAGDRSADGVTLTFQNEGLSALGIDGGGLGYVGISGPTAAYQMNIFSGHTVGTNFVTTNTAGSYNATGSVAIGSGHPIAVTLVFDPDVDTVTERLVDTVTGETYGAVYQGVRLTNLLGNNCRFGFTGADGGDTSIQSISDFSLSNLAASLGTAGAPLQISLTPGSVLDATAPGGVYVTSGSDLVVDSVQAIPLTIAGFTADSSRWALVQGDAGITDFSSFTTVGSASVTAVNGVDTTLTLTNNTGNSASAAWCSSAVSTAGFTVNFQYQATGDRAADGIAVVFQNAGTSALGDYGGGLGYVGIPGQTVAYEMNLYSLWGVGTNFVTTNSSTQYNSTGNVNIASGNPIAVQLVYDGLAQTMTETLTETLPNGAGTITYQKVYSDIRLSALLGPTATFGFTGGDGSSTSIQTITVLPNRPLFQQTVPEILGDTLVAIPESDLWNQVSAAWHRTPIDITQGFLASFTYQANGTDPADGLALVFQNEGLNAIGEPGGGLGYNGITGTSAAYEINLFDGFGRTVGSNVVTNGAWGTYNATGPVNFASGHPISVQLAYDASASTLTESLLDLETGDTWQTVYSPFNLLSTLFPGQTANTSTPQTAILGFTAADGGYFAEQIVSDFQFAYDVPSTGDIVLTSTQGAVVMAGPGSLVRGQTITIEAATAGGSAISPLNLHLDSQTLANGSVVGGVLNATVGTDLFVQHLEGNLRLGSIVATGTVSLSVPDGSLTDGLASDASSLNQIASDAHRKVVQQHLWAAANDPARQTIVAFEAQVDRAYVQYWSLVPYGTVSDGTFTLDASAIPQFEPQAALYYQVETATDAQVLAWASLTYTNCANTFANILVFGPNWASLPQFAAYEGSYSFTAPAGTVNVLSAGSASVFSLVSTASLVALNSAAASGNGPGVNVRGAQNLTLQASGTIGLIQEPVVISLADISSESLTTEQRTLLELASAAGALQMVGLSSTGETLVYQFGQPPAGVTPTGVQVAFSRPLFVELPAGGSVTATGTSLSLTQTTGTLAVNSVDVSGAVRLEAPAGLIDLGTAGPAVHSSTLRLITGGDLGSSTNPFSIQATGVVHANARGDLYLTQSGGDLQLGQVFTGGSAWIQGTGNLVDGLADNRHNLSGFNSDGTGWTTTVEGTSPVLPAPPTVSVTNDVATFTNPVNVVNGTPIGNASVLWRNEAVSLTADWTVGFVYQSSSTQGGLSLMLYNGSASAGDPTPAWSTPPAHTGVVLNLPGTVWTTLPISANQVALLSPDSLLAASPTPVSLGTGQPLQVVVSYSALTTTMTVTLTDLGSGAEFILADPGFDLLEYLGTNQIRFGFEAYAVGAVEVVQTVSDFVVLGGAANVEADSLTAVAGGGFVGFQNSTGVQTTPTANSVQLTDGVDYAASAVWLNTPLDTTRGFTARFTYQAGGSQSADGIAFVFQNEGLNALGSVGGGLGYVGITGGTAAYQMNLYTPNTRGTNFTTTNTSGSYTATGSVNIASGDPIDVELVYDPVAGTLVETLTDSTANTSYTHTYTGINLAQQLGRTCLIGFTGSDGGLNSIQTVTNFNLVPTGATATIGTSGTPLTLLVTGEVAASGPGGINLLQISGDLEIAELVTNSTSTITVNAPLGAVVGYSPATQPGGLTTVQTPVQSAPPVAMHLTTGTARISALDALGSLATPLRTRVGQLSAATRWGDLLLANRGPLTVIADDTGTGLRSGGALSVVATDTLQVGAAVLARHGLELAVLDQGLSQQELTLLPTGSITSLAGDIRLSAPDSLRLLAGSSVTAAATAAGQQIVLGLTHPKTSSSTGVIQSLGRLVADTIQLVGGTRSTEFAVAHSGLTGLTQRPVVTVTGTPETDRLIVDHRNAATGDSFVVSDTAVTSGEADYSQASIESLQLVLGEFADSVTTRSLRELLEVEVQGNGGDDSFRVEFAVDATNTVRLAGGLGINSLTYDGAGLPLWVKSGVVQSLTSRVQHTNLLNLTPRNIAALNGNPYPSTIDVPPLLVGLTSTQRYVQATYLQILQRVATPAELNQWTTFIDQAPTDTKRRTLLVDTLSKTDAARTLLLQAWYISYAGRTATPAEITTWLATFRAVSNPVTVQQRFLNSPPVYNHMQSLVTTGTPDQRYVSGLWQLLIDPGTPTSATTRDLWMKQQTVLGRAKMTANMLGHLNYVANQAQAFTQLINQRNAQFDLLLASGPPLVTVSGTTVKVISPIDLWRWLLTNRVV